MDRNEKTTGTGSQQPMSGQSPPDENLGQENTGNNLTGNTGQGSAGGMPTTDTNEGRSSPELQDGD